MKLILHELRYVVDRIDWTLLKVVYMAYIAQVPFRNVAYYRHEQRETLKDLGFEWIPEMDDDHTWLSELEPVFCS
jgi:hypothetical protein